MKKTFRKLLSLGLAAAMTAGMVTAASAASPVSVTVDGADASAAAYINDDWRTMVPVTIADQMGLTYSVSGNSVTFTGNGTSETYTVGIPAGGTSAELVDGTIYVPFAHLAQTFGYTVGWDGAAGQASADKGLAIDLDAYLLANTTKTSDTARALPIDRTEVNEHPLIGYYSYTLDTGRTIKLYMPEHAALRNYITVIAVPNGVEDTYAFLEAEGWIEQANQYGELLFVLEPAGGVWGTPAEEAAYLETCIGETVGNTAFNTRATSNGLVQSGKVSLSDGTSCSVFTGHSCNYYVGYGEGCAVLESWTSNNPMYVAAQAFVDGQSVGSEVLDASAARIYNGINTGSYYAGFDDETFSAVLEKMASEGAAPSGEFITNVDIPAPTLFVGYAADDPSISYWIAVNDAVATGEDGVYRQSLDSDAWQTAYANSNAESWGAQYGISQVQVTDEALSAAEIRSFLSGYTRYTNPFAYSNALGVRADYYETTKAAREAVEDGSMLGTYTIQGYDGGQETVELRALESTRLENLGGSPESGTLYSCMFAFNDYDDNGVLDPRETLMYIPDSAKNAGEDGVPVVVVFPGNTQAAATFFDCSMWWAIANDEGCAVIIMGEYCASNAAGLTYGDEEDNANFSRAALAVMENAVAPEAGIAVDMTRVYGSGHSLGCRTIQTLTHNSEAGYYAAVGSTSFPNTEFTADDIMPSFLTIGQADISEPDKDMVLDPWVVTDNSSASLWMMGCAEMNGIDFQFTANDRDSFLAACSEVNETGRYYTYTLNDENGAPLVQFTRTLAREHNCYPEEFRLVWDYVEHFRVAEDGTRYYSASAFAQDDAIQIG